MTIVAASTALASDFVSTSAGASDAGKVPKLDSQGKIQGSLHHSPIIRVYTSSGSPHTWSKPSSLSAVIVELVGSGGGGVGLETDADGGMPGGASAGYSRKSIGANSLGSTETIIVPVGGSGSNTSSTSGTDGQTTSFGSHLQATGGGGAVRPSDGGHGGSPGTGSGGDFNTTGSGGNRGSTATTACGGSGGSSLLGGGGRSKNDSAGESGGYGAGGSGASRNGSGAALSAGNGGEGVCIVTEFY